MSQRCDARPCLSRLALPKLCRQAGAVSNVTRATDLSCRESRGRLFSCARKGGQRSVAVCHCTLLFRTHTHNCKHDPAERGSILQVARSCLRAPAVTTDRSGTLARCKHSERRLVERGACACAGRKRGMHTYMQKRHGCSAHTCSCSTMPPTCRYSAHYGIRSVWPCFLF